MNWLKEFLSADNSKVDFKAVLATIAFLMALVMYVIYGIKGLFVQWDMPASIRDISVALILGGGTGAAATLLNNKLGVTKPPELPSTTITTTTTMGPVG